MVQHPGDTSGGIEADIQHLSICALDLGIIWGDPLATSKQFL